MIGFRTQKSENALDTVVTKRSSLRRIHIAAIPVNRATKTSEACPTTSEQFVELDCQSLPEPIFLVDEGWILIDSVMSLTISILETFCPNNTQCLFQILITIKLKVPRRLMHFRVLRTVVFVLCRAGHHPIRPEKVFLQFAVLVASGGWTTTSERPRSVRELLVLVQKPCKIWKSGEASSSQYSDKNR